MKTAELSIDHSSQISTASLYVFDREGLNIITVEIPKTTDIGGLIDTERRIERHIQDECIGIGRCPVQAVCRPERDIENPMSKVIASATARCVDRCPLL